jgi:hypothetical protein
MVELPLTNCRSKCRFPDTESVKTSIPRKSGAALYKNPVPSKVTCPDCGAVTSWMSSIVTAGYRRPRTQLWPAPIVSCHSMISDVNVYGERSSRQVTFARAASGQMCPLMDASKRKRTPTTTLPPTNGCGALRWLKGERHSESWVASYSGRLDLGYSITKSPLRPNENTQETARNLTGCGTLQHESR